MEGTGKIARKRKQMESKPKKEPTLKIRGTNGNDQEKKGPDRARPIRIEDWNKNSPRTSIDRGPGRRKRTKKRKEKQDNPNPNNRKNRRKNNDKGKKGGAVKKGREENECTNGKIEASETKTLKKPSQPIGDGEKRRRRRRRNRKNHEDNTEKKEHISSPTHRGKSTTRRKEDLRRQRRQTHARRMKLTSKGKHGKKRSIGATRTTTNSWKKNIEERRTHAEEANKEKAEGSTQKKDNKRREAAKENNQERTHQRWKRATERKTKAIQEKRKKGEKAQPEMKETRNVRTTKR